MYTFYMAKLKIVFKLYMSCLTESMVKRLMIMLACK